MGEKVTPWCHWPNPPWTESSSNDLRLPDVSLENTNSETSPTYLNSDGCIYSGVAASMPFFAASIVDGPSRFVTTLAPGVGLSASDTLKKRPLVFFHNENHTSNVGPSLIMGVLDPVPELQGSNETNVTDVGAHNTEFIHEKTKEINALLYSDSDEGCLKVQELNRVRKYPMQNVTLSVESVASAAGAHPAKKRRLSSGTDRSVVDTASSTRSDHSIDQKQISHDDNAQSCCIGEVESDHQFALREGEAEGDHSPDDQKVRREDPRDCCCSQEDCSWRHCQRCHSRSRRSDMLSEVSKTQGQDTGCCVSLAPPQFYSGSSIQQLPIAIYTSNELQLIVAIR